MRDPKLHYADHLFGRPCCGSESRTVTRSEDAVTCKTCQRVLAECARGLALRAEMEARHA